MFAQPCKHDIIYCIRLEFMTNEVNDSGPLSKNKEKSVFVLYTVAERGPLVYLHCEELNKSFFTSVACLISRTDQRQNDQHKEQLGSKTRRDRNLT